MIGGNSVLDHNEDFFKLAQAIELRDLDEARYQLDQIARRMDPAAREAVQQGRYARV